MKQAPRTAYRIEAVDSDHFLLHSKNQIITLTYNSFGSAPSTSFTEIDDMWSGNYYGDFEYDDTTGRILTSLENLSVKGPGAKQLLNNVITGREAGGYSSATGYGGTATLSTNHLYYYYGEAQVTAADVRYTQRIFPQEIRAAGSGIAVGSSNYYSERTGANLGSFGYTPTTATISDVSPILWVFQPTANKLQQFLIPDYGAGVLSNDSDADLDRMTTQLMSDPAHGALALDAAGTFVYTPNPGYSGTDTFTYLATDGALSSAIKTVTINVTPSPPNAAPVAANDAYSVTTNTPLVIDALSPNDSHTFPGLYEIQSFTADFSASQMEYSPQYHLLFVREGVSRIHVIDTQTQAKIGVQQAGESFTDMDLSADGRYLYVAEYGEDRQGYVRRFDALTQTWDVRLANTYLVHYIEAVDGDRFLGMSRDQSVIVTLNSWGATGPTYTELSRETPSYYGDMEYDGATGRIYFGNSGISTPYEGIAVLEIQGNALIRAQGAGTPGYGSSNVLSADGKYFFYGQLQVLAATPNTWLHAYPESIRAATSGLAFGDTTIYNSTSGATIGPIGFTPLSFATTENAPEVWMYEPSTNRLHHYRVPDFSAGVLSNDSDPNQDQLFANLVTPPMHGTLSLSSNGFFTYTPNSGYQGFDSFTYRASDGAATSNLATVNLAVFTPPTVTLGISGTTIAENSGSATITATLSATCIVDVTVNLSRSGIAVAASDYTLPDAIVIPAGSLSASVTLASVNDTMDESDESVIIDIASVANGIESGAQQVTATILDDDSTPTVQFSSTTFSASEGVGTANVVVLELSNPADYNVVVPFSRGGTATVGTDYTAPPSSVTFTPGTTTQTISIPISNDTRDELDETITFTIGTPTGATVGTNSSTTFTIQDDDPAPNVSFSAASSSFTESGSTSTFVLQLSAVSNLNVTVPFTMSGTATNPADYTLNVTSPVTINAGSTSLTITLTCVGDTIDEPNETVILTLGEPTNATLGANPAHTKTILDNDSMPTVSFAAGTSSVREGATLNIQLNLTSASGFDITVPLTFTGTATSGVDYTMTTPVVIPAGNATYQAALTTVGDGVTEGSETAIITMGTPTNAGKSGTTVHTATIQNNNVPIATGESYSLWAGASLTIAAPGLLANDSDPDSNPITAVLGTGPSHGALSLNADGSFTYTPTATYSGADSFTYRVSDGALQTAPVTVNLTVNSLRMPTFTPTTTGFVATFDQDLNTSVLNLFDQDHAYGTSDVTLVGSATGAVRGSLVIDATSRKVTFIASGGILSPDNYTATFRSATSGFSTSSGSLLDGNSDGTVGDDAVRTFRITTPATNAVVLGVADFTRGYGQAVNLPANTTTGIPITISSGLGISGLDFKLLYNPALLTISSVTAAAGISAAVTYNTTTPGVLVVTVSTASQFSSSPGAIRLLNIAAQVPASASYGAKQLLDLTNIHAYDASANPAEVPTIDDDGLHVAAYFGDANGSQSYNSPDATAVQRMIVGSDSGLAAYRLIDPYLIVDISGNGMVQSNDVTAIQRMIVGLPVDEIPPYPGLALVTAGGPDPLVYVPQNLAGAVGQSITVPVELLVTEPTGITLSGVDLAIGYDASKFQLTGVQAGDLAIGFGLSVNTATPGIVRISLAANSPLDLPYNLAGKLAALQFTILSGAGSSSTINLLGQSSGLYTALYDEHGQALTLLPAPTDDDSDAVDGRVQIDWPQAVDAALADEDLFASP